MGLTIIGVRHGEVHNPKGVIYSGLSGYNLSETGRAQALSVAEALMSTPVVALYASPLDRAMETASYISAVTQAQIVPDERLHEWRHWQQWAGMTWDELRKKAKVSWDAYTKDPGSVTTGESLAELQGRMASWLADAELKHTDGTVVAVTHLEPLRAILLKLLARPLNDLHKIEIGLCDVVRLFPVPDVTPLELGWLSQL